MENLRTLSRWYVYELIDPRCGCVFYVGKGTGARIDAHEAEAVKKPGVCSKKLNKIRDITGAGLAIAKRKVAFFWDEQAAYDHETDLISEYGLATLTNVLPGGQKAFERRQKERESRRTFSSEHVIARELRNPHSALFARMADWFRFGGHEGKRIRAVAQDRAFHWNAVVTEVCYNNMFAHVLKMFMSRPEWKAKFADVMKVHGVELVYGRA